MAFPVSAEASPCSIDRAGSILRIPKHGSSLSISLDSLTSSTWSFANNILTFYRSAPIRDPARERDFEARAIIEARVSTASCTIRLRTG